MIISARKSKLEKRKNKIETWAQSVEEDDIDGTDGDQDGAG